MSEPTPIVFSDDDDLSEAELRESIAYIRSLPVSYAWSWRTLRRERYGPDMILLSWVDHAERLLDEIERLRGDGE